MRIFFIILFVVQCAYATRAQSSMIELYKDSIVKAGIDSNKAYYLYTLSYYYQNSKPDSSLLLAQAAYSLSLKSDFLRGKIGSLGQMALAFNRLGNYDKALEKYLEQLKLVEKQKDPYNIASTNLSIALVYNSQKDAAKALPYAYKADSIAKSDTSLNIHLYTALDIGEIYYNNNQLDSALHYITICYNESLKEKKYLLTGNALNNIGNIYFKSGNYDKALYYLKSSVPYLDSMQDYNSLAECNLGMAKAFDKLKMQDSAFFYAYRSFRLASNNQFLNRALNASAFLTQLYKKQNQVDSAFAYTETYLALKDSFDNSEKIKQLQSLTIAEQLRQQQIAEDRIQERKDRRIKLELLTIGMFIPIFFFISVYLSRKKVHKKVIQFLGIFSLLLLFEYIIFLIHPVVANATGHSAALEILIFVAIAAIISPAHHRIEHWLTNKLEERHANRFQSTVKAAGKKNK
ncbi:MAG TPA: tetratricopeptide repeat protein [Chitinophagaceae bacterium]|nr:tetratricopeptide repeat protein [Chitinophagaceae bacterium]